MNSRRNTTATRNQIQGIEEEMLRNVNANFQDLVSLKIANM